jgi:hypothetical protein
MGGNFLHASSYVILHICDLVSYTSVLQFKWKTTNGYLLLVLLFPPKCVLWWSVDNVFYFGNTSPFDRIIDIMQEYPGWKLIFKQGSEAAWTHYASYDPEYAKYWKRVQSNPEEFVYKTMKEGLDWINNNQMFMFISDSELKGYFRNNPFHIQRLDIYATVEKHYKYLAFPFNSPLKVIFERTMTQARERGIQQNVQAQWFGGAINKNLEVETMVLTLGQVIMIYALMLSVFVFCIVVFCGELIYKFLQSYGRPISGKQREQAGASAGKRERRKRRKYVQKLWNPGTAALGEGGEEGKISGPGGGQLQVVAGNEGEEQKGIKHHYLRTKAGLGTGGWIQEEGAQHQPEMSQ